MPTRSGWAALLGAVASTVAGRLFGVIELYVLGVGVASLVVLAWLRVRLVPLRLHVERRVEPDRVHAGVPARVELLVRAERSTPELELWEPVAGVGGAALRVAPLRAGEHIATTYRLPTAQRGLITVGPLEVTVRDSFGLARRRLETAPTAEILVYPHVDPLPAPALGSTGRLGASLSRRLMSQSGGSEFHSQRSYVPGDDLRRVNWRASARADDLIVLETAHETDLHLHVVLDLTADAYHDEPSFERAVSAAASVVAAASAADMPVELALTDGTLLPDAPDAAVVAFEHLALVAPLQTGAPPVRRHQPDALQVNVVVTGLVDGATLDRLGGRAAGAATRVLVCCGGRPPTRLGGWLVVDATSDGAFAPAWASLVGAVPEQHRRRPRPRWNPDASATVVGARS